MPMPGEMYEMANGWEVIGGKFVKVDTVNKAPDIDDICTSCAEDLPQNECPKSKRPCGHHCNHSWNQDECCWCGKEFGEGQ